MRFPVFVCYVGFVFCSGNEDVRFDGGISVLVLRLTSYRIYGTSVIFFVMFSGTGVYVLGNGFYRYG